MFKPMLAAPADLNKLRFPLLASPKLDGVRAIVKDGVVLSRSLKPIPNKFVQQQLRKRNHLDGELIVGSPTSHSCYRDTVSAVMSIEGEPDFTFYVFDSVGNPTHPYGMRRPMIAPDDLHRRELSQVVVRDMAELLEYEDRIVDSGFEGVILRDPEAPYKFGRSTVSEGYLLKLKRFIDEEAEIIGMEEELFNGNEATTNELGRTARSSHRAGKTGKGTLGALVCTHPVSGVEFRIGTGFTASERADFWQRQHELIGRLVKFKHFPVGAKTAPRHPVYLGLRDPIDT